MSVDWEWRQNLKVGDVIDCLDRECIWYLSTIIEIQGPRRKATIGFRVYTDEKDPVGDYKYCNTFKKHFKGWDKKDDELIYLNDPRIQK